MTQLSRLAMVAAAALLSVATSSQPSNPPPQYPPGGGNGGGPYQQGGPYGGGGGAGGTGGGQAELAPPPEGGTGAGVPGQDYCFSLKTAQTTTSICGVGFSACERERQGAVADGLSTTDCVPWAPVACFQLAGDPSPASRWCAANLDDCETWRRADLERNGKTGDACAWKQ